MNFGNPWDKPPFRWPLFSSQEVWNWHSIVKILMYGWCFLPLFALTRTTLVDRIQTANPKSPTLMLWMGWIGLGALIASSLEWTEISIREPTTRENEIWNFGVSFCNAALGAFFHFLVLWSTMKRFRWIPLFLLGTIILSAACNFGLQTLTVALHSTVFVGVYYPDIVDHLLISGGRLTTFCGVLLMTRLLGVHFVRTDLQELKLTNPLPTTDAVWE